ncbi:MAG TPA: hypothetical protein VJC11_02310 [Patescibacteria group bacterium]|nr:hypothetical protein [Patescibacteria group bacterium]
MAMMIGTTTTWAANQPTIGPCEGTILNLNLNANADNDIGLLAAVDTLVVNNATIAMTPSKAGIGLVLRDNDLAQHAIWPLTTPSRNTLVTTAKYSVNGNMPIVGSGALKPDIETNHRAIGSAVNVTTLRATYANLPTTATRTTGPNRHPLLL